MPHSKKKPQGREDRLRLVTSRYGTAAWAAARDHSTKGEVADDDILDAFAALWTAERILRGEARSLPPAPPTDRAGLPMRIVY